MFTGIVQNIGRIDNIEKISNDSRFTIDLGKLSEETIALGDSIAVSGVCLTAVELNGSCMVADVSAETLDCTTLGSLKPDDEVNLELALKPTTRLGGHLVSGHVDGVGEVVDRFADGRSERIVFRAPSELSRYIAAKGSICIDGVSLTVNAVDGDQFGVNIVPHTAENTNLGRCAPGVKVNLEIDVIARYLERLLSAGGSPSGTVEEIIMAGDGLEPKIG